jgi:hypothetical protein
MLMFDLTKKWITHIGHFHFLGGKWTNFMPSNHFEEIKKSH